MPAVDFETFKKSESKQSNDKDKPFTIIHYNLKQTTSSSNSNGMNVSNAKRKMDTHKHSKPHRSKESYAFYFAFIHSW